MTVSSGQKVALHWVDGAWVDSGEPDQRQLSPGDGQPGGGVR